MSEQAIRPMSADDFLEWSLSQQDRYELVDGVPQAMTGAKRVHDQIVANAHGMLFNLLRGHRCRYFTADTAVRSPNGNIRRPDAGVDCGAFNPTETWADAPFLLIEVLSPSTRAFDTVDKVEEYKSIPSLRHIVLLDPDTPEARHWFREPDGAWGHARLEGLEAVVNLPDLPGSLDLATLYEGVPFRARPRLIREGGVGES